MERERVSKPAERERESWRPVERELETCGERNLETCGERVRDL